ncbi:hypothetical protein P7K49_023487, partial [Saguinus oedipus]
MFGKRKKRVEISAPSNFEHCVHMDFNQHEQKLTGYPPVAEPDGGVGSPAQAPHRHFLYHLHPAQGPQ